MIPGMKQFVIAVVLTASKVDNLKVRIFGDTAVAVGVSSVKGRDKKNDISGQYRWTDTFVKQNGGWRAVASQVTFAKNRAPHAFKTSS
jgi:ketosteroid isomerase-like protein